MIDVPNEFRAYHKRGGKLEGSLHEEFVGYFQLWPVSELALWNQRYEVEREAPGYVGFGSNGGGEMLAFDAAGRIYALPFLGMEPGQEHLIAESWKAFEELMSA